MRIVAIALGVLLVAAPASADVSTGFEAYALGGVADLQGKALTVAVGQEEPAPLEGFELELTSDGRVIGGGMRIDLVVSRFRMGADLAAFTMDGVTREHGALTEGYSIRAGDPLGMRWALFGGYELLNGPVYPYLDLRVAVSLAYLDIALSHEELGDVGSTGYAHTSFGFGPRAGLMVPIVDWAMVDVSAYYPIVGGHEQFTFTAGLSFWSNRRNDETTRRLREAL